MVAWIISSAHNAFMLNLIDDSCPLRPLLSCLTVGILVMFMGRLRVVSGARGR